MEIKWILSWVGVILVAVCIVGYTLYQRGKLTWLKRLRMPKLFEPKNDDLTGRLKLQTEKEVAKAEELKKVLEAKKVLVIAKAENTKLRKEIDGLSERSLEKEQQERMEQQEDEKKVVKPKRL